MPGIAVIILHILPAWPYGWVGARKLVDGIMESPEKNTELKRPSLVLFFLLVIVVLAALGLEWLVGLVVGLFKTF